MLLEAILARTATSQFTNYCKIPDALGGFDLRELAEAGASRLSSPSLQSSFTICLLHHASLRLPPPCYLFYCAAGPYLGTDTQSPPGQIKFHPCQGPDTTHGACTASQPVSIQYDNLAFQKGTFVAVRWTLSLARCHSTHVPSPPLLSAAPTTAAARLSLSLSLSLSSCLSLAPFHTRAIPLPTLTVTLAPPPPTTPQLGRSALPCE